MRVAYQGIPGSFSHQAAVAAFGAAIDGVGTSEFREIFSRVDSGDVACGVVPLENSIAGSIYENYDLLARYDLFITRELYIKIEHHLLVASGITVDTAQLTRVYSHPKALEQCSVFLEEHPKLERIVTKDTGTAAKRVQEMHEPHSAAIASPQAAALYGLSICRTNIENAANNFTRFVILQKERRARPEKMKCSVILALPHKAGSLLALLTVVSGAKAQLTKIESRPIPSKPFEYLFYLDFEISCDPEPLYEVLREQTTYFKVLGEYESSRVG